MSTSIKGQLAALGLAIVLATPAYSQADSSAKRIRFTDISIDNNGSLSTLRATDAGGNTYHMRKVEGRVVEFEINDKPVPKDQYRRYEKLFDELGHPPVPPVPPVPPMPAGPAAPAAPVSPGAPAAPPAAPAPPVAALPPVSPTAPTPPAPPEPPRGNKYVSKIIDELIDKGIIQDDVKLIFSLDNVQLTVNGVKQPDEVFQAFKQKYIKHPGDHVTYERSGLSSISNIKIEDDNH
jgi:hypothetical protein